MADFNRFDICEAWFCFACDWHGGQNTPEYAILGRLTNIGFKPAPALCFDALEINGKRIYRDLVAKHHDCVVDCETCYHNRIDGCMHDWKEVDSETNTVLCRDWEPTEGILNELIAKGR
jgi:hypothetical protein